MPILSPICYPLFSPNIRELIRLFEIECVNREHK